MMMVVTMLLLLSSFCFFLFGNPLYPGTDSALNQRQALDVSSLTLAILLSLLYESVCETDNALVKYFCLIIEILSPRLI